MKSFYVLSFLLATSFIFSQVAGGNVGVGTNLPQNNLHVKGSLRLEHPTQGEGNILQVLDQGSMKWSPYIPSSIIGTLGDANGYSGDIPTNTFLNGSVTVSPGKWLVKVSLLIPTNYLIIATDKASSMSYNDVVIKITTYFTDSNSCATPTLDYIPGGAQKITGSLITPSMYGMAEGYALIENKTAANKTYYLWGRSERRAVTSDPKALPLYRISAFLGENRIYAYSISTTN